MRGSYPGCCFGREGLSRGWRVASECPGNWAGPSPGGLNPGEGRNSGTGFSSGRSPSTESGDGVHIGEDAAERGGEGPFGSYGEAYGAGTGRREDEGTA